MPPLPHAETYKQLVNGTARGPAASLARGILGCLAVPYQAAVAVRNGAYDIGLLSSSAADVPVVSIGNLTLGGTGKTPLVAWLTRSLANLGLRPAIVSRGYAARQGERSDEAAELALVVPGVMHVANRDRVAATHAAVTMGAQIVVLDDGFQHRRLCRDLDIVAVDATDPFGVGRLFPRGLLREPLQSLSRAQAVVLTRADAVDAACRAQIRATLEAACGKRRPDVWAEARHRPVRLRTASSTVRPVETLASARVAAFTGIGNPAAFRRSLEACGAGLAGFRCYPDHHAYTATDLEALDRWATGLGVDLVVTTLKDLVKIDREMLAGVPLVALEIAMEVLSGGAAIEALLASTVKDAAKRASA